MVFSPLADSLVSMADDKKGEAAEAPKSKLPIKMILSILFAVVNLTVSGGGLFLVYMATLGYEHKTITETTELASLKQSLEAEPEAVIYTMDPLTVNLDGQPRRIIRTVISLEMMDSRGFEEVVRLGAQSRDEIVRLFNRKQFTDIETIQGKLYLKDQIARIVNSELKVGVVKDVYFNEFVIQ